MFLLAYVENEARLLNSRMMVELYFASDGIKFFFAHSVNIKLALPQAAHVSLHFRTKVENQLCCTSTRDLIKDTPVTDREKGKRREKSPKHSGSLDPWSDVLPLELPSRPIPTTFNLFFLF